MAFKQFPNQQYFRILETDIIAPLGYFNLDDGTELKHVMLTVFQRGLIVTPYTLRLNIYGSNRVVDPIVSSDWATMSASTLMNNDTDPAVAYTQNWLGNIYMDFQGNPLNPNVNYFLGAETSGYTRNADAFYVGINLDWYSPVNNALSPTEAGARIRILGKR